MLDWLACAAVRALGWLLCRLPPWLCAAMGASLGEAARWLSPTRARLGYLNLKAAFGERLSPAKTRRLVRRVFRQLGMGLVEMLRVPAIDRAYVDRYVKFVSLSRLDAAAASGRPVMVLTAHFGNWELSSLAGAVLGYPVVAVARAQASFPRLYRLLVSYRESKGCRVVHKGVASRQVLHALERRQLVGIVGDQASRHGLFIPFFGRPALFATGPFELARLSGALIIPMFTHRRRGPFHRIMFEPPIDLSLQAGRKEDVLRWGMEQFAQALARHIRRDPAQWLWLHKRWKHTPTRRVMVLSDGKAGHVKQSLAVMQAMRAQCTDVREQVVEVRYHRLWGRALVLLWAWLVPRGWAAETVLRVSLSPASWKAAMATGAEVVISCGASTAPVNVLLCALYGAKSVVVMNPAPIPLRRFHLAFVPAHDEVPTRPNVVPTAGALSAVTSEQLAQAREHLRAHPRFRAPHAGPAPSQAGPVIAVLLGGSTDEYQLTPGFADGLVRQVLAACQDVNGVCLVTTSRRTGVAVERLLSEQLSNHPRCGLLLLASRDQLNGTLEGMLGWADVVVVTGESISMMSEACASGKRVIVVGLPLRHAGRGGLTKAQRYIRVLTDDGYARAHPLPEVGYAIHRALIDRHPVRRLDSDATVASAIKLLF